MDDGNPAAPGDATENESDQTGQTGQTDETGQTEWSERSEHVDPTGRHGDGVDRIQQAWTRERPGTPVESIGAITRVWRVGKILGDERRRTLARLGIDAGTLDLLSTLRRAGPPYRLAPGEIAKRSLVSAGAVSQRLTRAERANLIRRERSRPDGRSVVVELTPSGHALIERAVDGLLRHEEGLLSALSAAQRDQLVELLRILLADLMTRFGVEDRP